MKEYRILVWFFYMTAGEQEKDFSVHSILAKDVQDAVNKAADLYNSFRAIPFSYEYEGVKYAPTNFNKLDLLNLTQP